MLGAVECAGGVIFDTQTQHPAYVTLPYGKTCT